MQNIKLPADDNQFGVTLILLQCAFSAELQRDTIGKVISSIDAQLTQEGAPDDDTARIEMMIENATAISKMLANREIEDSDGATDIAYSFIYALSKKLGIEQLTNLRGLTGSFLSNELSLNPCLDDIEYQHETAILQQAMMDSSEGNWELPKQAPHTVH